MSYDLSQPSMRANARLAIGVAPAPAWQFRSESARGIRGMTSDEGLVAYSSQDAMRFGPRYYDENQVAIIHAAVAERQDLPASPLPLN